MSEPSSTSSVTDPDSGSTRRGDTGVRLIMAYKLVKGGLALALSMTLGILLAAGATEPLRAVAANMPHHFAGAWSIALAKLLLSATEPQHLFLVAVALGVDGVFTLVEGWALRRGHWWGPWLVLITTSSLLPFEVVALVHKVHAGRVIVLVLNVAIVAYLAWRRYAPVARRRH